LGSKQDPMAFIFHQFLNILVCDVQGMRKVPTVPNIQGDYITKGIVFSFFLQFFRQ